MAEDPDPTKYLFVSLEQKRKDQSKPYDGKKMVWVPDEKDCYIFGNIKETKADMVVVDVGKGEDVRISFLKQKNDLVY
jgi:myosin heavy chain 6/7